MNVLSTIITHTLPEHTTTRIRSRGRKRRERERIPPTSITVLGANSGKIKVPERWGHRFRITTDAMTKWMPSTRKD